MKIMISGKYPTRVEISITTNVKIAFLFLGLLLERGAESNTASLLALMQMGILMMKQMMNKAISMAKNPMVICCLILIEAFSKGIK